MNGLWHFIAVIILTPSYGCYLGTIKLNRVDRYVNGAELQSIHDKQLSKWMKKMRKQQKTPKNKKRSKPKKTHIIPNKQ